MSPVNVPDFWAPDWYDETLGRARVYFKKRSIMELDRLVKNWRGHVSITYGEWAARPSNQAIQDAHFGQGHRLRTLHRVKLTGVSHVRGEPRVLFMLGSVPMQVDCRQVVRIVPVGLRPERPGAGPEQ